MDLEMRGWDICHLFQAGFKIIKDEDFIQQSFTLLCLYAHC